MKGIFVNKVFDGSLPADRCNNCMEEIFIPLVNSFNNLTLVATIQDAAVQNIYTYEYIYKVEDYENMYLVFYNMVIPSHSGGQWSICSQWTNSLDTPRVWNSTMNGILRADRMVSVDSSQRKCGFEFYYITDENNNLKMMWEENPLASYFNCFPSMIVTTAKGKRGIVIASNVMYSFYFFYLDDPNWVIYYIHHDQTRFTSDSSVVKVNYLPILRQDTANGEIVDVIDEELVRIFNTRLEAYDYNYGDDGYYATPNYPFIRKLIKVDNMYYRQTTTSWWYEDPFGEEEIVKYVDEDDE